MEVIPVTLNPNDMGSGFTLSNGNLTIVTSTDYRAIRATHGKSNGKWYWEVKYDAGVKNVHIGVSNKSFSLTGNIVADSSMWRTYYGNSGNKYPENTAYSRVWDVGTVVGVALDLENGTLEFFKDGVSLGISHTNVKELGEVYPTLGSYSSSSKTVTINFGASPFVYSVPNGFKAYNVVYSYSFLISSEDEYYSIVNGADGISIFPKMESRYVPYGEAQHNTGSLADGWKAFDKNSDTLAKNNSTGYNYGRITYIYPNNSSGEIRFDRLKYKVGAGAVNITLRFYYADGTSAYYFQNKTITNTEDEIPLGGVIVGDFSKISFDVLFPSNSHPTIEIYEFDLIETIEQINKKIILPPSYEELYSRYGMDRGLVIDPINNIGEIQFVEQVNTTLGSGKVFKQKIDTTKIPIKKASIT